MAEKELTVRLQADYLQLCKDSLVYCSVLLDKEKNRLSEQIIDCAKRGCVHEGSAEAYQLAYESKFIINKLLDGINNAITDAKEGADNDEEAN